MANAGADNVIVFDMDSTLIQIECIDEIALLTGAADKVARITEQAMRGELDFEQSLRARVACLTEVEEAHFINLFEPIPLTTGASDLLDVLRQHHWRSVLVSGGFSWFAKRVAEALQLDEWHANQLASEAGKLTGLLQGKIVDAEYKAAQVRRLQQQVRSTGGQVVAVGDGANDIPMLQAADVGVAFCAKPIVKAAADYCIDSPDLTLILPLLRSQGLLDN